MVDIVPARGPVSEWKPIVAKDGLPAPGVSSHEALGVNRAATRGDAAPESDIEMRVTLSGLSARRGKKAGEGHSCYYEDAFNHVFLGFWLRPV